MSWRALSGLGLMLAACGSVRPTLPRRAPATVVGQPNAPETLAPADTAAPRDPSIAPTVEHRVSWYGLSLDLSDAWHDETNYGFEAAQGTIEKLVFEPSELQPPQVNPWLEEVRKRVDGAYGAKPSVVELYENPNFAALGVRILIKPQFLYDIFVTLDDRVLGITAKCRTECDATVRSIVHSLSKPETAAAPAGGTAPQHRYRVKGLVFDSSQAFDLPNGFMLLEEGPVDRLHEYRVSCSRTGSPPEDSTLPSEIHWSNVINDALTKLPRVERTLTGKPDNANKPLTVRLYHREGYVTDELGETVLASSSSAVIAADSSFFACHLRAVPSSPTLLARFRRLLESARRE